LDRSTSQRVDQFLDTAEEALADFLEREKPEDLDDATTALRRACTLLIDPTLEPSPAANDDGCQIPLSPSFGGTRVLLLVGVGLLALRAQARD
jgi:hypothetical protein